MTTENKNTFAAIAIDKKSELGKQLAFVSLARQIPKKATKSVREKLHITTDDEGNMLAVATDGNILFFSKIAACVDGEQLPVGNYTYDETKTKIILELSTEGAAFPPWRRVVPLADSASRIAVKVELDDENSGRLNSIIGRRLSLDGHASRFIRNSIFVKIEKAAKGQKWEVFSGDTAASVLLKSNNFSAVIMLTKPKGTEYHETGEY